MRGFYCTIIYRIFSIINVFRFFSRISLVLLLASCNYKIIKDSPTQNSTTSFGENATVDAVLVQQSVLAICLRCHAGNTNPNLSTIDAITSQIDKIKSQVMSNQMPPSSSGYAALTDCQKDILNEWIRLGMPSTSSSKVTDLNSCKQGTPIQPAAKPILEMPLNYQTFVEKILQPKCLHCHNEKSGDLDASQYLLYPYAELIAHKKLFSTDGAHSKLYKIVSRNDDERMPPPKDSAALATDEQDFILRWLDNGYPEN